MNAKLDRTKVVCLTIRAWSNEPSPARHTVEVEPDGTVRVWNDLEGYYTVCHSIGLAAAAAKESAFAGAAADAATSGEGWIYSVRP